MGTSVGVSSEDFYSRFTESREEKIRQEFSKRYKEILVGTDVNQRTRIYQLISNERARQDYLHGADLGMMALAILGEEFGEVCKAQFEKKPEELREELVHLAAVAVRWLEEIDT